jgi:hypothetical protein
MPVSSPYTSTVTIVPQQPPTNSTFPSKESVDDVSSCPYTSSVFESLNLRTIPLTRSALRAGSVFYGEQSSGSKKYKVAVHLKVKLS